jgi:hypothetical protein
MSFGLYAIGFAILIGGLIYAPARSCGIAESGYAGRVK